VGTKIRHYRFDEPGTLGYVCNKYFGKHNHSDCPFRSYCTVDNKSPIDEPVAQIIRNIDADTLEAMAKAIRSSLRREHGQRI
jgi:hypothetical protein